MFKLFDIYVFYKVISYNYSQNYLINGFLIFVLFIIILNKINK